MKSNLKNLILFKGVIIVLAFWIAGCTSDKPPEPADCNVNPVKIQNISTTEATCGLNDGTITINAAGGSGEYQYSIDGENFQTGNAFDNLVAGNYAISVMDANECFSSTTAVVESNVNMAINAEVSKVAGCDTEEGTVSITVTGGNSPYQYKLGGGSYQDGSEISGLPAGDLTVFARDANGCEVSTMVNIITGISLDDDVLPILVTNCAISGCHDGNGSLPDWSDKTSVINNATNIKTRTGNGTMPPGNRSITDEEIQTIKCWVDDGSNDN
jgi:hypothetical protein